MLFHRKSNSLFKIHFYNYTTKTGETIIFLVSPENIDLFILLYS